MWLGGTLDFLTAKRRKNRGLKKIGVFIYNRLCVIQIIEKYVWRKSKNGKKIGVDERHNTQATVREFIAELKLLLSLA